MSSIAQTICLTGEWWLVAGGCPLSRQPCRAHMPCSLRDSHVYVVSPRPVCRPQIQIQMHPAGLGTHTACQAWVHTRPVGVARGEPCTWPMHKSVHSCTKQPGRPHRPFPRPGDVGGGPCIVLDVSALKLDGHLPNSVATDSRRGAPNRGLGDARTAYAECTSEH